MPTADVYLCDKLEDHGKGTVCKRVVSAGVSITLTAYRLTLVDGETVTVQRAFCNANHAQHWLRRIAVNDLLTPVVELLPMPPFPGDASVQEAMRATETAILNGTGVDAPVDAAVPESMTPEAACTLEHTHCWPHAVGDTCAVPGCGHYAEEPEPAAPKRKRSGD